MLKLTVIGRLGKDAELREINGKIYISFSVAAQKNNDETQWVSVLRHTTNESKLINYLKKGTQVYLEGTLEIKNYQRADGEIVPGVSMIALSIELLSAAEKVEELSTDKHDLEAPVI